MPTLKLTKLFHLLDIFSILLTSEPRELLSNSTMHLHTYCGEKIVSLKRAKLSYFLLFVV